MHLETRKSFPRLVMLCGVKRPSTEFDGDIATLVCVCSLKITSARKLHRKKNMKLCLVRFVLINNALKLLQRRILALKELDYEEASKYFFSNTFKHGLPSVSVASSSISVDLEELMAAIPSQCWEESLTEDEARPDSVVSEERRASNGLVTDISLANFNLSCTGTHLHSQAPPSKKPCQDLLPDQWEHCWYINSNPPSLLGVSKPCTPGPST